MNRDQRRREESRRRRTSAELNLQERLIQAVRRPPSTDWSVEVEETGELPQGDNNAVLKWMNDRRVAIDQGTAMFVEHHDTSRHALVVLESEIGSNKKLTFFARDISALARELRGKQGMAITVAALSGRLVMVLAPHGCTPVIASRERGFSVTPACSTLPKEPS